MSTCPIDRVVAPTDTVVVLGEFDGVHRGHAALVAAAHKLSTPLNAALVGIVADRGEGVPRIMNVNRRCELLLSCGLSSVSVVPIPRPFDVEKVVGAALEHLRPVAVFLDRESWPSQPRRALAEYLHRIGAIARDGASAPDPALGHINSAAIIHRVRSGDIRTAAEMLGRPYELTGRIVALDVEPSPTGFQTVQVIPAPNIVLPGNGVYAARTLIGRRWVGAAVNVGTRPTFGLSQRIVVESHLIGYAGELQETELCLRFVRRLRDELQFSGLEELVAQIKRDVVAVTSLLRSKA